MKKEKEMSAPSPHLKESFLLLRSKEWAKGEKERRKEKIGENLVFLVGVRDQLQQRLHLVSYPLPPKKSSYISSLILCYISVSEH